MKSKFIIDANVRILLKAVKKLKGQKVKIGVNLIPNFVTKEWNTVGITTILSRKVVMFYVTNV